MSGPVALSAFLTLVPVPVEPRRPEESAISEGNLVENPLFLLTNKEARPLDENGEIRLSDYLPR